MTETTVVGLVYQLDGVAALAAAIGAYDDAREVANEAAQAAYVYASCEDGDAVLEAAHAALDAAYAAAKVAHVIDDAAYESN